LSKQAVHTLVIRETIIQLTTLVNFTLPANLKAAVNVSVVAGILSQERAQAMSSRGRNVDSRGGQPYSAAALSLVYHPAHPYVPTLRADVRRFKARCSQVLTHHRPQQSSLDSILFITYMPKAQEEEEEEKSDWLIKNEVFYYKRTSISGTKKAQITFPLRHLFALKVVK
jgi:hypothetical protein